MSPILKYINAWGVGRRRRNLMRFFIMKGIYKITSPSGKIYIGQSTDINKRFKQYKYLFNTRNQVALHYSFKKYGIENHVFEIIEECEFDLLNERERYWQDFYNVIDEGLNCKLTSTNIKKSVLSENTKQKMSIKLKGKKAWNKGTAKIKIKNPNAHKVINIKTNEVYNSLLDACNKNGLVYSTIHDKLSGRRKSINDTDFRYLNESLNNSKYPIYKKDKRFKNIIHLETGIIYENIKIACSKTSYNYFTFWDKLNNKRGIKNDTGFQYLNKLNLKP